MVTEEEFGVLTIASYGNKSVLLKYLDKENKRSSFFIIDSNYMFEYFHDKTSVIFTHMISGMEIRGKMYLSEFNRLLSKII